MSNELVDQIIKDLAAIGKTSDGGSNRLGFSHNDILAREYIVNLIKSIGLDYRIDEFGNIIARYSGTSKERSAVATGSHIDTVPNGGNFDGVVGVACGIAAIKAIKEEGVQLKYPLELIIFQLEESSRFGHATMGSKIMAGVDVLDKFEKAKDKDGLTLPEVLKSNGLDFAKLNNAKRTKEDFLSFIEVHIDQCKELEKEDLPIGIVEAIAAPTRFKVTIEGEASHSGTTKISDRKDALVASAELILAVRNLALVYNEKNIIATVGNVIVFPGAMNVVPGKCELYIDLRGIDKDIKDEVALLIEEECMRLSYRYSLLVDIDKLTNEDPVKMDKSLCSHLIKTAKRLNISHKVMISGAGQDTMNIAKLTKTAMIFVRTKNGLSHHPKESAKTEDIEHAYNLLKQVMVELATENYQ